MTRPNTTVHDAISGETIEREMTEEEYQTLLDSGWTEEPAPVEEAQTSTDAG
jgi:hypothetical protein